MTTVEPRTRSSGLLWLVLILVIGAFGLVVAALVTSRTSWAWGSVAASGVAAGLLVADWVAARRRPGTTRGADPGAAGRGEPVGSRVDARDDDRDRDDGTDADDGVGNDADPLSASLPGATADGSRPPASGSPDGSTDVDDAAGDRGVDVGNERLDRVADGRGRDDGAAGVPEAGGDDDNSDGSRGDEGDVAHDALDRDLPPIPAPHVEPAEERADAADAIATADLDAIVRVIDERPRYHLPSCRWVGDRDTIDIELAEARELGFTPCSVCRPDTTLAARARRG